MIQHLSCHYYQQQQCGSCQWLTLDYQQQLAQKQQHLQQQLGELDTSEVEWFAPFASNLQHFRNKAKMAVSGSVERPILGIAT